MDYWPHLFGGCMLGVLHALDADHVSTVTSLLCERRTWRRTFLLALRWSLGHGLTLLVLALLMTSVRNGLALWSPDSAERAVGLAMIALGISIFWRGQCCSAEVPHPDGRGSGWVLFGMGVLHGTAGSSAIFLLIPVALSQSPALVALYVALFSLGMVMAMGTYALAVHKLVWLRMFARHLQHARLVSACVTVFVGIRLL